MERYENISKVERYCPKPVQLHESERENKLVGNWGWLNLGIIKSKMEVHFQNKSLEVLESQAWNFRVIGSQHAHTHELVTVFPHPIQGRHH